MNCESCQSLLLDLVYGELDTTMSARAREHLVGCASCRAASEKLESARRIVRQLPMAAPPPHVHASLMARAQAHARGEVVVAQPKRSPDREPDGGSLQRFMSWLGGFVLGPQVAMAMVLMLVVGVGLYYLPGLRTSRNVPGGAIVNADPGDEVGPSAAIEPAAPLDLRLDTRTNRIHSGQGAVLERGAVHAATEATPEGAAPGPRRLLEAQGTVLATPLPGDRAVTLDVAPPPAEVRFARDEAAPARGDATGFDRLLAEEAPAADDVVGDVAVAEVAVADTPTIARRETQPAADTERPTATPLRGAPSPASSPVAAVALAPRMAPSAVAPSAVAPSMPMPAPMVRAPAQPVMVARNAPSEPSGSAYGGLTTGSGMSAGAAPQAQAPSPLLAAAGLHGAARNQARANALRDAIGSYESLLTRYPSYDHATDAMLELAELYRRVGDLGHARSWLARAERVPAYEARARQQRFRLDEMDRARSAVPASAGTGN